MAKLENTGGSDLRNDPPKEQPSWKNQKKLIHEALMKLAEISPKDANLIRMHLEGCSYEDMAMHDLAEKDAKPEEVSNLTALITKQFSNNRTGSMAKLKIIIKRLMEKKQFMSEC